jgi:hypothetical protein
VVPFVASYRSFRLSCWAAKGVGMCQLRQARKGHQGAADDHREQGRAAKELRQPRAASSSMQHTALPPTSAPSTLPPPTWSSSQLAPEAARARSQLVHAASPACSG